MCTGWIVSVSIGSDVCMVWSHHAHQPLSLTNLKRRSLLLMEDEVRFSWRHAITQTAVDIRPMTPGPWRPERERGRLGLSPRNGVRYSLTFRKTRPPGFKCQCQYPEECDVSLLSLFSLSNLLHLFPIFFSSLSLIFFFSLSNLLFLSLIFSWNPKIEPKS